MKHITKSWKTTGAAVSAALVSIFNNIVAMVDKAPNEAGDLVPDLTTSPDWAITIPLVILAVGLFFARDHSVSSEEAGVTL